MADPKTCRHRIVGLDARTESTNFYCVSCDTPLTIDGIELNKEFEYNIDGNVWVYVPEYRRRK